MTKKGHKCEKCKGVNGIYVKICEDTGEIIENYEEQYQRQVKDLLTQGIVKHVEGVDEH